MKTNLPDIKDRKVIIAMSGGVDSAVAALLLQQRGAQVEALHMTNWEDDDGYCTAADDLQDARMVCEQLGIPLHHVNFAEEYRARVFAYFLDEYQAGRTPNPDVLCNREIKFGVLWRYAKRLGADLLATGHYAQLRQTEDGPELLKGRDPGKDQTYFLHAVAAEPFKETLFPIGHLLKSEVRDIAKNYGLVNSEKKDSTGICFIGERPFKEFLQTYLPASPGQIQTLDGDVIGQHSGLMYYTIGQRQGLGIGGLQQSADAPWYVVDKRLEENVLLVAQGEHPLLYCMSIRTAVPAWIGAEPEVLRQFRVLDCAVKIRYRQGDQTCQIRRNEDGTLDILFDSRQRAVAPGQYAVFYSGDRCLGGAVIERILSRSDTAESVI